MITPEVLTNITEADHVSDGYMMWRTHGHGRLRVYLENGRYCRAELKHGKQITPIDDPVAFLKKHIKHSLHATHRLNKSYRFAFWQCDHPYHLMIGKQIYIIRYYRRDTSVGYKPSTTLPTLAYNEAIHGLFEIQKGSYYAGKTTLQLKKVSHE